MISHEPGLLSRHEADDGVMLAVRDWPLESAARGVLIVHGYGEHSGRYSHLAAWFRARGYAVRSYDHRGHGLSPGRRGAIRAPDDLPRDLATIYNDYAARFVEPPLLVGHSMGGLTAARAVLDGRLAPCGLVLSSPALRLPLGGATRALALMLGRLAPSLPLRAGVNTSRLSHNAAFQGAIRRDAGGTGWITPALVAYFIRAGEATIRDAGRLATPTLLLAAGDDRIVDVQGSLDFAAGAPPGMLRLAVFEALFHEIFNESPPAVDAVFDTLGAWLAEQAPRAPVSQVDSPS